MSAIDLLWNIELIPFNYTVYVVSSEEQWNEIKTEVGCTHEPWLAGGSGCTRDLNNSSLVSFTTQSDEIVEIGIAVHEAVHVFQNLCEFIGESNPSAEFEAYYIQHISTHFMCRLKTLRNTNNGKDIPTSEGTEET